MTPRWRRELRLLRRDGPVKYVRVLLALRRFHRTLAEAPVCTYPGCAIERAHYHRDTPDGEEAVYT